MTKEEMKNECAAVLALLKEIVPADHPRQEELRAELDKGIDGFDMSEFGRLYREGVSDEQWADFLAGFNSESSSGLFS